MGNKSRGEFEIEANGKRYRLPCAINAICEIQDALELDSADQLLEKLAKSQDLPDLRKMLWGILKVDYPDLSLFDAGEIIQSAGVQNVLNTLTKMILTAFPKPEPGAKKKATVKKAGTGGNF